MKRIVLGLVLMVSWQSLANNTREPDICTDETWWVSRLASSGSQIAVVYLLPSYGIGSDIKFGLYFSAGMENPWKTACVLVPIGIWGGDPVALSVAFSLFNRGMALTTLHQDLGLHKWMAFGEVALLDLAAGQIPGCKKFKDTKWMAAVGNSLENAFGPLAAGVVVALVPWTGALGDTASSEFSEESGMRVIPGLFDWNFEPASLQYTVLSGAFSSFLYAMSHQMMTIEGNSLMHNLASSWTGAAAMSFMINTLVAGTKWVHQMLNA
ncbi:MAG: hypothetical protein WCK49_01900 [Myxococcaceae bacterium]